MKQDELSSELQALLDETPVLKEQDIEELAEAVAALDFDPEFVADCIKGDFVNDILHEMAEQGLNNNQLAKKWGKSRQHVGRILDKEKAKNFTIDSMVSLSMVLGLRPEKIVLKKMMPAEAAVSLTSTRIKFSGKIAASGWCAPFECDRPKECPASKPMPKNAENAADEQENLSDMAA